MTAQHKLDRIKLAKKYLKNPKIDIVFSDEKKFLIDSSNGKVKYVSRQESSNPYDHRFMDYGKQVSSKADLNVWMYIGQFGKGEIFVAENIRCYDIDGKQKPNLKPNDLKIFRGFDAYSYLCLLKYKALPLIKKKVNRFVFMHDNASIHKANQKKVDEYSVYDLFEEHGIEIEDWPARSPDLNPVENCWSILDKEKNLKLDQLIKDNKPIPKNKEQMFQLLKMCWDQVDNDLIIKIYNSFINRLKLVIKNDGCNNFDYKTK